MPRKIFIDAGTYKNRICLVDEDKRIVKARKGKLSNNQLEYLAMLYAMQYIGHYCSGETLTVFSDSKLIVNQLNGSYKTQNEGLSLLRRKCVELIQRNSQRGVSLSIEWIPRERNKAGQFLEFIKTFEQKTHQTWRP